ncbi:hypothetical protein DPM19_09600 [Actinomadura craniellae]|uniref:Uncharacterized protein n=1 Tax=Actinomadura craniellae TaxID=2231787 RepID=A0A365H7B3_9ACTN|nr:hypothetical protein [Actinomadura craniellae]RAY14995.1 hypothetical protein DPM19_09600 [Actinomadura craniellae]
MNETYPDPVTEGLTHSGQRLVQIIALATAGYRSHALRKARSAADAARADSATRSQADAEAKAAHAQARARWAPAHDRQWLDQAGLLDVAAAWGAAVPHAADHASAASAVRKCEQRLRNLHPHAMDHYDRHRAAGHDLLEAMRHAAPFFTRDPNVRTGHPATRRDALAEGTEQRWAASVHGPDRHEWDAHRQELRAQQIIADLQRQAHAEGRPHLLPAELHSVLGSTTNLPDDIIAKAVRTALASGPVRERTPVELAAEDFPYSIEEAMRMTVQRPLDDTHRRPPAQSPDQNRRRNR